MCHKFMAHPLFSFLRSFFHRISRMNRMAILLIGLLTDFRGYLAAGQWLAPEIFPYCFCHADFADDADFFLLIILVPQISRISAEFFGSFFFLISINHNIMVYNLRISEQLINPLRNS